MMFSREYWFNSFPFLVASCNLNIRRLTNRDEREKMVNGEGNEKNGGMERKRRRRRGIEVVGWLGRREEDDRISRDREISEEGSYSRRWEVKRRE
jgi:hypothetical protein